MTNADNAKTFALEISRLVKDQLPEVVVEVTKKLTLDALRGVVRKSPVGNPSLWKSKPPKGYVGGQFRGAWQTSVGTPATAQSGQPTSNRIDVESQATAALATLEPYGVAYIVNGLPYAERLENGWSTQAPLGMVQLTVQELNQQIIEYEATLG